PANWPMAISDINNDGRDEVVARPHDATISYSFDPSNPGQPHMTTLSGISAFHQLVPLDADVNGKMDFIGRGDAGVLTLYLNTGDNLSSQPVATGIEATDFAIAELDL